MAKEFKGDMKRTDTIFKKHCDLTYCGNEATNILTINFIDKDNEIMPVDIYLCKEDSTKEIIDELSNVPSFILIGLKGYYTKFKILDKNVNGDKMAYELAKKYVYSWNDVSLAWLNRQDAFEVDGDSQTVVVYSFRLMPWCY